MAGKGNTAAHGFREFLCDRHAKSRTVVGRLDTFVFASEGFKDPFLVLLAHTDPGILTNKRIESAAILTLVFPEAEYDFPMIFIVLHSVTHDIHQKTLQVTWTAYEIPVCNGKIPLDDFDTSFLCQLFDDSKDLIQKLLQMEGFLFEHDFTELQFPHIKHFIDELQEQLGRFTDLPTTFVLLFQIIGIALCHRQHANDAIDRCTDIMAHALEKFCLRDIGGICAAGLFQKALTICFCLFLLLLLM